MQPEDSDSPDTPPAVARERQLIRKLSDPVVAVSVSGGEPVVRAVNEAFACTFDVDRESVHDTPPGSVLFGSAGSDRLSSELDGLGRSDEQFSFDVRPFRDEDRVFHCTVSRSPAKPAGGDDGVRPIGWWLIFEEVTDAGTVEERRRERETRDAVIRHVSHDVRNPLEIANIHLEAAQETGSEIHFERVSEALDRIEQLVSEVLTLPVSESRPETREPERIHEVAREAWETVNTGAATLSVDEDLPTVEVNAAQLRTLFENLFQNAVKHGGADVSVSVGRMTGGIYVADDGAGLPSDIGDDIFEPGRSADDRGSGLGLSIVAQVAEKHGWDVRATDSASGGARFEIVGVGT